MCSFCGISRRARRDSRPRSSSNQSNPIQSNPIDAVPSPRRRRRIPSSSPSVLVVHASRRSFARRSRARRSRSTPSRRTRPRRRPARRRGRVVVVVVASRTEGAATATRGRRRCRVGKQSEIGGRSRGRRRGPDVASRGRRRVNPRLVVSFFSLLHFVSFIIPETFYSARPRCRLARASARPRSTRDDRRPTTTTAHRDARARERSRPSKGAATDRVPTEGDARDARATARDRDRDRAESEDRRVDARARSDRGRGGRAREARWSER